MKKALLAKNGMVALAAGVIVPTNSTALHAQDVSVQETATDADPDTPQTAPGVNPKDNITKAEIIFQHDNLENGTSATTLALKYDAAFDADWGGNVELPIINLHGNLPTPQNGSTGFNETALGDLRLRARNVRTWGPVSVISAVEVVVPTATSELTGAGKLQVNPVLGAVYAFNQQTFAFAGYKHYFSIAGDDQRENVDRSEVRVLFARLFSNATWSLGDVKYSKSHTGIGAETIDVEAEYGAMLSRSLALSGRIGTSFLDSNRQFGMSVNLRKIF